MLQLCTQIQNADPNQVWQIVKFGSFNTVFSLSAGLLSLILMIGAIYTWYVYQQFSTPSDILLAITISEFIQNLSIVIQAFYFLSVDQYTTQPPDFQFQCSWMGIISIIGYVSSTFYNLIYCVLFSYSIQNTLKNSLLKPLKYHIISFIIVLGIILALVLSSSIGRSLNGVCGLRIASRQSTSRFLIQLVVAIMCIYSMIQFKRKLPKNDYFQKQAVFGYYYYYMGIFVAIQLITSLSYLISDIMCKLNSPQIIETLDVFYSISLCTSTLLSYGIVVLRFNHPYLLSKIMKFFKRKDKHNQNLKQFLELQINNQQTSNDQQINSWLGCLLQSLKGSQILSFIQGISIAFAQKQKRFIQNQSNILSYQKHYIFQINEKIISNYIQKRISSRESLIRKQNLEGLNSLHYEVTSYCPEAFSSLNTRKQLRQIIDSLSIKKNINIVKKQSYTNGGKSGQFFFGTFDHRLIIKTIKQDQIIVYLQKIKQFVEYFKKQQTSLIVPIIGMFKFERKDINQQPTYLILMYNLTLSSKQNILRIYDIKGSEFNRSLIDQKKIQIKEQKLRKYTLKDKDFEKLQQKVRINQSISKQLKRMLRKDLQFLGILGFMDYSFLIIKRKGSQIKDRNLSQIPSNQQENVIYNFGIIDYLQSWTLKRKAQRAFKTLITNKQVTADSPLNYSNRLSQFIDSIL